MRKHHFGGLDKTKGDNKIKRQIEELINKGIVLRAISCFFQHNWKIHDILYFWQGSSAKNKEKLAKVATVRRESYREKEGVDTEHLSPNKSTLSNENVTNTTNTEYDIDDTLNRTKKPAEIATVKSKRHRKKEEDDAEPFMRRRSNDLSTAMKKSQILMV